MGTDGRRHLHGRAGDDYLEGAGGNDDLFGDDGNNQLFGRKGNDRMSGGNSDDRLEGGRGRDRLNGGPGNDTINGGLDHDSIDCGPGDDTVVASKPTPSATASTGHRGRPSGPVAIACRQIFAACAFGARMRACRAAGEEVRRPLRGIERRGYSGQIPNRKGSLGGRLSLAWKAEPASVAEARRAAADFAAAAGVGSDTLAALRVAVSEAVNKHGRARLPGRRRPGRSTYRRAPRELDVGGGHR